MQLKSQTILQKDRTELVMKKIHFNATEENTDYLFQIIGTDNIDAIMNKLIEQEQGSKNGNTRKQY
jgi:hypothetical protein